MTSDDQTAAGRRAGHTPPRQFRLGPDVLADLDLIAAYYSRERGRRQTRTDGIRIAAAREAARIRRLGFDPGAGDGPAAG